MAFLLRSFSAARRLYQPGGWSSLLLNNRQQQRFFASDDQEAAETKKSNHTTKTALLGVLLSNHKDRLLETACTGTGQVLFLNSHESGAVILVSLALADPMVALMAGTGSLVSTITADTTLLSSSSPSSSSSSTTTTTAIDSSNGLFSYNGCLVGCATAGLICPGSLVTGLPLTVVGAAVSTYITAIPMTSPMPQWTIAFNLLTYTTLLALYNKPTTGGGVVVVGSVVAPPIVEDAAVTTAVSFLDIMVSPLTGIGQIFVVESAIAGFGIALAMARYSPQVAMHAVLGSAVGGLTGGLALSADASAISAGLWGYNSALTSAGTAVFLRQQQHSKNSSSGSSNAATVWLVSGVGASLTAVTFGAVSAVSSPVPCLTIPFCIVMSGIWWMAHGKLVNGVALATSPHSPERNFI